MAKHSSSETAKDTGHQPKHGTAARLGRNADRAVKGGDAGRQATKKS